MAWSAWNDTWLDPRFRAWTIEDDVKRLRVPVLEILGAGDQYSTPSQVEYVRRLATGVPRFESLLLEDCGHAPHRDQPEAVLAPVERFILAV
jgi:pimeloyl-ACP methyl ester carboxylesterase